MLYDGVDAGVQVPGAGGPAADPDSRGARPHEDGLWLLRPPGSPS